MDNIYVFNYLVQRQIVELKRRLVSLFVDLKAAFNSVDREILIRALRERRIRDGRERRGSCEGIEEQGKGRGRDK